MLDPGKRLSSLRECRVFRDRASPIGQLMQRAGIELKALERRLGGTTDAWSAACPKDLVGRTSIVGLSRGVLTIRADDAAVRFEIDRWLRTGGDREFLKRCPTTVRKVKIVIGDEHAADPTPPRTRSRRK